MAMKIAHEKMINPELLTEQEIWYLFTRGKLPASVPPPSGPPHKDPPPPAATKVTPLEQQTVPSIGAKGGIVAEEEEEDEDYEEGWNNDQRRAELSRRGLKVDGGKTELIGRLLRSDQGASTVDDQDTVGH